MTLTSLPNAPKDTATRYLCAAAYLQDDYRNHVLELLEQDSLHAVCPSFGVDSVAILRHATAAHNLVLRRDRLLASLSAAVPVAVWFQVRFLPSSVGGPDVLLTILCAFGAAWAICAAHLREIHLRAVGMQRARTDPRDAPPVDAAVEARLEALATTNLIVYNTGRGDPFIGSGQLMSNWLIKPVDVSLAATDSSGRKATLIPFTAAGLHHFLAKRMPSVGFNDLTTRNRLFIRGDCVAHLPQILPDKMGRPVDRAPSDLVKAGANDHQDYARTYLCLHRISNGGMLVVSMFVRARLTGRKLTVECLTYVLPPVSSALCGMVSELPNKNTWSAVRSSRRGLLRMLLGAPGRCFSRPQVRRLQRAELSARREIRAGMPFDYGAFTSFREAWADDRTTERFKLNDVTDDYQRLRHQLLSHTEKFLEQHGVDTAAFKDEVQQVNQQISNYSIQSVNGTGNYIGGHGQVNNTQSQNPTNSGNP